MSKVDILSTILRECIKLPEGVEFFDVDGQVIFPIRNDDGSIRDEQILYLVKRGNVDGTGWFKYGIFLSKLFDPYVKQLLEKAKDASKSSNLDGGDLGLEG